jgi:circadian clock protein KaiB
MKAKRSGKAVRHSEGAASNTSRESDKLFIFRLYVTGSTPNSVRAVENIKRICEKHLGGCYELSVVDLYEAPAEARREQIVAAPTLVRSEPEPRKKVVGSLSDEAQVLRVLGIGPKG